MRSKPIITVRNLSKRYILGANRTHDTLRDHIVNGFQRLLKPCSGKADAVRENQTLWALKDVSFDVEKGDVIGVIGRNGAGKSTLLKILSQITEPSEGEVRIRGRMACLLEVGTGFHSELTGRENIYLNGAILGMGRAEITRKFDEIVAFAEVEKFLDTPVKRYSSGMYVRLAFAVAAHLEPEILVVDEVLAVGDAAFQSRCLAKMGDVAATEGRTVLFVSHNMAAVQRLCNKGIYLESGAVKLTGTVDVVMDAYQRTVDSFSKGGGAQAELKPGEARFTHWELMGNDHPHTCFTRSDCKIALTIASRRKIEGAYLGFAMWDSRGELVIAGNSRDADGSTFDLVDGCTARMTVNVRLPIKGGLYQMEVSLNTQGNPMIERCYLEPKLNVLPLIKTNLPEKWHGWLTEEISYHFEIVS